MSTSRKVVLALAVLAALLWASFNWSTLSADHGITRVVLCAVFATLLLARPKSEARSRTPEVNGITVGVAVAGTLLSILGIILTIHQFKWLGIILLLFACLHWALPASYRSDIFRAIFILYWSHPLPAQALNPIRFALQRMSVVGSEIVLHCLNVRVWADGLVLHTASHTIGVPETCSGMNTAVAAFLCLLGTGMLFRLRIIEHSVLIVAGLFQVLLLNVARISYVVAAANGKPDTWSAETLHETTGLLLLVAIILVNAESVAWQTASSRRRARQKAVDDGIVEPEDHTSIVHPFWSALLRHSWLVLTSVLLVALLAFVAFKRRPYHRAMMIAGTVGGLTERSRGDAEAAINAAIALVPDDHGLHTEHVKVLLLRRKYDEALAELKRIGPGHRSILHTILEALALMSLDRPDEAVALVDGMPARDRELPGVAMVRAEFSALRDQPELVASNVVRAASWGLMIDRARDLFPYLAARRRWQAIADCHAPAPYRNVQNALAAIHALIKTHQYTRAGNVLVQSLESWPGESKLIEYLAALALEQPGSKWEDLFAKKVKEGIRGHSEDELALYIEASFRLSRPELAWLAYSRLEETDPNDPAVLLAPAQYGDRWFTFRKEQLGMNTGTGQETVDIRDNSSPLRRAIIEKMDPLSGELTPADVRSKRNEYLQACLDELARRRNEGTLSVRMQLIHVNALELAGKFEEAYDLLGEMAEKYPDQKKNVLLRQAALYERQGDPAGVYEVLLDYDALTELPELTVTLLKINSLMQIGLGAFASTLAEEAQSMFPESVEATQARAAILAVFGFPAEALFTLAQKNRDLPASPFVAKLLWDAQLFKQARQYWQELRIRPPAASEIPEQFTLLPAAELATGSQLALSTDTREMPLDSRSPYVSGLARLSKSFKDTGAADPEKWMSLGRDQYEQAMALHEMAALLIDEGKTREAATAVSRALELLPSASALWRLHVGLAKNKTEAVARARQACPNDSEIWLAEVVTRGQRAEARGQQGELKKMVREAAQKKLFSVNTFVRAGDYLLRNGFIEAADAAARYAAGQVDEFLPAHFLAIRTAIALGDMERAISQSDLAAACAVRPRPFHRLGAALKTATGYIDDDTLAILNQLVKATPENRLLARQLGDVYLRRGDPKRAMSIFTTLVSDQPKNAELATLVGAAEAARRSGRLDESVDILENAHRIYPSSRVVLNNLVYNLALHDSALPRARTLLPEVTRLFGEDSVAALDTIAFVHARSGEMDKAEAALKKAIALVDETDPLWFIMNPTAVDVAPYRLLSQAGTAGEVIRLAEKLASKVKRASRKPGSRQE